MSWDNYYSGRSRRRFDSEEDFEHDDFISDMQDEPSDCDEEDRVLNEMYAKGEIDIRPSESCSACGHTKEAHTFDACAHCGCCGFLPADEN